MEEENVEQEQVLEQEEEHYEENIENQKNNNELKEGYIEPLENIGQIKK